MEESGEVEELGSMAGIWNRRGNVYVGTGKKGDNL